MICVWVSWPWVSLTTHWSEAVTWVRSISISFWKSKTPFEMSSAIINFGNQRLPEKSIWNAKTKKYFFFLIKDKISKSKKTRQDKNQNKWILWVILSNTVDINLGRRYLLKNIVNPSWAIRLGINLVPRAFPSKNGWGRPHPFFEGKALGTRLLGYGSGPSGGYYGEFRVSWRCSGVVPGAAVSGCFGPVPGFSQGF